MPAIGAAVGALLSCAVLELPAVDLQVFGQILRSGPCLTCIQANPRHFFVFPPGESFVMKGNPFMTIGIDESLLPVKAADNNQFVDLQAISQSLC